MDKNQYIEKCMELLNDTKTYKPCKDTTKKLHRDVQESLRRLNREHEILGVVTGVEHFHQYLFGCQFTLYTDHKPIESLVLKPLVETSPRIQQLLLRLTQYHINMKYKSGKHLLISDCLSRLSNPNLQEEDKSLNLHVTAIESEDNDSFISLASVREALMEDPVSVLLGNLILNGWPDSCK